MNFGGGLFSRKAPSSGPGADEDDQGEEEGARHRTKKEIMEEVIAKSKMFKAIKQQQKEEDEIVTDKLDESFTELLKGSGFAGLMRPKGVKP